ncbi:MAG: flagellar basal body-associated FliL family protein, partial [bacterium]
LVIIIAIVAIIAVGGVFVVLQFVKKGDTTPKKVEPVLVPLNKEILTNIVQDGGGFHYIKVSIVLEVTDRNAAKIVDSNIPMIRDEIIAVFKGTRMDELSTPGGVEQVKLRIVQKLNSVLSANIVKNILFTDMVVQ